MPTDSLRFPEERRLATVLFADVQGFTALAEQLDFETVSDLLKGIWEHLDKAIESHNGYIDKHLGDGVMAIWGAPYASETDAEQAVDAGLDLIKALQEYCLTARIPGAEKLMLRVGINTGSVFAGYVGTRREYTVFGDTVNLASRLEQIATAGTVVIGENTLRMVRNTFRVRRLEPTMTKGKTELVQPYMVDGRLPVSGRSSSITIDSLVTHMVGRDDEQAKLGKMYEAAFASHKPVMTLLSGDVGIGKTRLLLEFGKQLETSDENAIILSSHGYAQKPKTPYLLWRMLLRNCFEIREDDPAREALARWKKGLDGIWQPDREHLKYAVSHGLGELISRTGETLPVDEETQARIFMLVCELLRNLAAHGNLVLFFDDLQWADRESMALLASLLTSEDADFSVFILGTARQELFRKQSQWHNLARVINLLPLELTPQLLSRAFPDLAVLPEHVLEDVSLHAEGNPYFLEEIVKNLVKGGLLDANIDALEVRGRLISQIPEALRVTLQARMDNLSREARAVAMLASVVGRVFWVGAVLAAARSTPLPGSTPIITIPEAVIDRFIQDGLRQLVRADLAFPRPDTHYSDEQEYFFKNSYLRDVAYDLIPNRSRVQYHTAVAEWMLDVRNPALKPMFQSMARDHQRKAAASAKIPTGSLVTGQP